MNIDGPKKGSIYKKQFKTVKNGLKKSSTTVKNGQYGQKLSTNGQYRSKTVHNGKNGQYDEKRSKMVKNSKQWREKNSQKRSKRQITVKKRSI